MINARWLAAATQEEVLQSISNNFERSGDPFAFLAVLLAAIGGILLIVWIGHYRRRAAGPKHFNHPGKLVRELTKKVGLKPAEVKKLRTMAEEAGVSNPIVLMLCPSVLSATMRKQCEQV